MVAIHSSTKLCTHGVRGTGERFRLRCGAKLSRSKGFLVELRTHVRRSSGKSMGEGAGSSRVDDVQAAAVESGSAAVM